MRGQDGNLLVFCQEVQRFTAARIAALEDPRYNPSFMDLTPKDIETKQPSKSVFVKTFGCQMNVYDSDRMMGLLQADGFSRASDVREADVILVNTCSIRDKSEHKVLSLLGQLRPLKEKKPDTVIGITGCVAQRLGRTLLHRIPHLDLVMGPDSVERVVPLVKDALHRGLRTVDSHLDTKLHPEARTYTQPALSPASGKSKPSEFLTIMKGCDHFCTYCIVPYVRGRERSRSIAEVIRDVENLVAHGTREVVFLGQNINTYGKGSTENLAQLLEAANGVKDLERIRYVTSHPRDLGDDLIAQFGTLEKLCPALHLPFQSGSNAVLKRMSRLYRREDYLEKTEKLRAACPSLALSADVIVGFPSETDQDFEETLDIIRKVEFSTVFSFKYSPRPGTRAIAYKGDEVPETVKDARLLELQVLVNSIVERENASYLGRKTSVLMESLDRKARHYTGRNPQGKLVHVINAGPATVGKTLDIEVTECTGSNLRGYLPDAPRMPWRAADV